MSLQQPEDITMTTSYRVIIPHDPGTPPLGIPSPIIPPSGTQSPLSPSAPPTPSLSSVNFFHVYYSNVRFIIEACFASAAVLLNTITLLAMLCRSNRRRRHRMSLYNILFINLSVANVLSCCLYLFSNNVLIILRSHLATIFRSHRCLFYVHILAAVFLSSAFSIITLLTMLAFSVVQYLAICQPLQQLRLLRHRNLYLFVIACWSTSAVVALVPYCVAFVYANQRACDDSFIALVQRISSCETNISALVMAAIYVLVVTMSAQVYARIRSSQRPVTRTRSDRHSNDLRGEKKAFFTIFFLLATLTLFFVPYTAVHLLSLNFYDNRFLNNPFVIYYMNLLPYIKYMTDPIIYGLRMRELKEALSSIVLAARRGLCGFTAYPALTPTHSSRATITSQQRRSSYMMSHLSP